MTVEVISGPEVLLRSDQVEKSCRTCSDIPVPTFQPHDDITVRANHYVRFHGLSIVADYEEIVNQDHLIRFIELGGQRSAMAEKALSTQLPLAKPDFQPLCPSHLKPMLRFAPSSGSFVRFWCTALSGGASCHILWDSPGGYGKDTGHTLPYHPAGIPQCPKFGHGALFIQSVRNDEVIWECPIAGCSEMRPIKRDESPNRNA